MNWGLAVKIAAVLYIVGNVSYTVGVTRGQNGVRFSWKTWMTYPAIALMALAALPVHVGLWGAVTIPRVKNYIFERNGKCRTGQ